MKERNPTIDFLRGLAVFLMIFVHVTAFYWRDPQAYFLWDYAHFVVPLFVFCSAYVYFSRPEGFLSMARVIKRLQRLVVPYYAFLVFFLPMTLVFSPGSVDFAFIKNWLLLGTGQGVGWLVVLFAELICVFALVSWSFRKRILSWGLLLISLCSSLVLLLWTPPLSFRVYMWLPWMLVVYLAVGLLRFEKHRVVIMSIASGFLVLYIALRQYLVALGEPVVLTSNKYPPNLYYLSYGLFWCSILYISYSWLVKKRLIANNVQKCFDYLSNYSYSLFFIHFLFVYFLRYLGFIPKLQWVVAFSVVFFVSVVAQVVIDRGMEKWSIFFRR